MRSWLMGSLFGNYTFSRTDLELSFRMNRRECPSKALPPYSASPRSPGKHLCVTFLTCASFVML